MSFRTRYSPRFQREDPTDSPLIRSIYDDEFDSTILDPSWTRVGAFDDVNPIDPAAGFSSGGTRWSLHGSPAPNARPSWYMLQTDTTSVAEVEKLVTFPSEFFAWSRMSFAYRNAGQANNDGTAHLSLKFGAGLTDLVTIYLNECDANTVQVEVIRIVAGASTSIATTTSMGGAGLTQGQVGHTVGIQGLGTTFHFWLMSAAGNWLYIGNTTYSVGLDRASLRAFSAASTSPGNVVTCFDFFRFKAGRHLP